MWSLLPGPPGIRRGPGCLFEALWERYTEGEKELQCDLEL